MSKETVQLMKDRERIKAAAVVLSMCAEDIILAYAYRFKIKAMFREMKQCFGGFCYHSWSKAVSKLDCYLRKAAADPLEQVKDGQECRGVLKTLKAMEGYVRSQHDGISSEDFIPFYGPPGRINHN